MDTSIESKFENNTNSEDNASTPNINPSESQSNKDDIASAVTEHKEHSSVVAAHYNHLEDKGLDMRYNSPIFYLRNFNNWVKSVLIQKFIEELKKKRPYPLNVLDICCGKGGDLAKWCNAHVDRVIFADIADVSVQQCEARYNDRKQRSGNIFQAEFIAADCTKETLRSKYKDPSIRFSTVSCQFGLHYSFESLPQARQMLKNISECLNPGGYFFGTIPDAYEIISRAKKSENNSFGNRVYSIKLHFDPEDGSPLFGGKYYFHLDGVVDCPEFLVNFRLLTKLAAEYGLELVYKARFEDFFNEHQEDYKQLLYRIKCFESYPAPLEKKLIGEDAEYEHAKQYLANKEKESYNGRIGTMSSSEWEVAKIYVAFAFKKINANDKQV